MTWGKLARILGREGADLKVSRNFYIAVTQQVLLFGAETWVITKSMEAALDAFQGRVARRLTGRMPRRGRDRKWLYPPLAGATKEAGIVRARTSVLQRQNTVAQFIATRPILGLCEGTERRGGTPTFCTSHGVACVLSAAVLPCPVTRPGQPPSSW